MRTAHLIIAFLLLAAGIVAGPGCVASGASRCSNDLVCPTGMTCSPAGDQCVYDDLMVACRALGDGEVCSVAGMPPGKCLGGVCQASRCGDSRVTGVEECDGATMRNQTCQMLGYYESAGLGCTAECKFDTSQCVGRCGDGVKNGDEQCDGADLGDASCLTAGYHLPKGLACKPDCSFETAACGGGRCGDGVINGLEQCDGSKFNKSCSGLGFNGAMSGMACTGNCLFSSRSCLCAPGQRCAARTQRCECTKFGCGCVAAP
jgi:hypothetical protein